MGKFEMANGGTLFLDEIGELPLDLQPILLRAVETKKFSRIGSNTVIDADVRIISATNENLEAIIAQKRFRLDLYYRLCTMSLRLPSLREREGDITLLAEHFARSASRKMNSIKCKRFEPEALELLERLPWNGNVRELQKLIEMITQIYPGDVITVENLLENINDFVMTKLDVDIAKGTPDGESKKALPYKSCKKLTVETIKDALITCKGNKAAAAMQLGISRKTLYRHMARLGNENFAEL